MPSYEQRTKLDIIVRERYLHVSLVETVVKANKASLHSLLLYYVQFGVLFIGRHFAIPEIHRFLGVLKF